MSDLLSVIVPVYNTKPYLQECFDSLLGQSYQNIEIIVVDDGSTDGSAELCDEYAQKEPRIKVYHQPNSGVSSARNLGIDKCQGEYVSFMDSDDQILPDIYSVMIKSMKAERVGLAVSSFTFWYPENGGEEQCFKHSVEGLLYRDDAMCEMLKPKSYRCYLYNKVFLGDVLRSNPDLRLDISLKMMEDLDFVIRYVTHIERAVFLPQSYYLYRMRSDSASHQLKTFEHIKTFEQVIPYVQKHYQMKCEETIRWNYYATLLAYGKENKKCNVAIYRECLEKIQDERRFFLTHNRYSLLGYFRKLKEEFTIRYMS